MRSCDSRDTWAIIQNCPASAIIRWMGAIVFVRRYIPISNLSSVQPSPKMLGELGEREINLLLVI